MNLKHKKYILRFFIIIFCIVFYFSYLYLFRVYVAQKLCPEYEKNPSFDRIEKSIDLYSAAMLYYQEPFVFEQSGILLYQIGSYDSSYIQLSQAIKFRKKFPLYEKVKSIVSLEGFQTTNWEEKQILLYYMLGDISTKLGNYNQCVDDYSKMFEVATQHGKEALERENRGFCYYKLGMYQEAYDDCVQEKEWLNNKISILPDNKLKEAYINRIQKIDDLLLNIANEQGND